VAAAVVDLAERPSVVGTYTVGGDRPAGYGWEEIVRAAWGAVGRRPTMVHLPSWALMAAGAVSELSGPLQRSAPIFTRGKAREVLHGDWAVLPTELAPGAPAARFTLEAGFADAVGWYRATGWL
jgi:hypothetical protein